MTAHCSVTVQHSIVTFSENKSTFHVHNKNKRKLLKRKVDGCLIVNGRKCDWLLVDSATQTEVFIELKGGDVDQAVEQLCISSAALSSNPKKKYGYVVCTRCPISSPAIQRLQKEVMKSHRLILRVKKTIHTEQIEALI